MMLVFDIIIASKLQQHSLEGCAHCFTCIDPETHYEVLIL